jgi:metal-responsive CopG/Arc/MetJ family transcriptional regulator
MRTIIDLPDHQVAALATLGQKSGKPRAELIRQAVDLYLREQQVDTASAFGLWTQHSKKTDGVAYQKSLRAEWQ